MCARFQDQANILQYVFRLARTVHMFVLTACEFGITRKFLHARSHMMGDVAQADPVYRYTQ